MWCTLTQTGKLENEQLSKIEKFLAEDTPVIEPSEKKHKNNDDVNNSDDDTDAEKEVGVRRWGIEVDSSEKSDTDALNVQNMQFLKQSLISTSNTLDVIAIANVRRVVILEKSQRNNFNYDISALIDIKHNMTEDDYIHSILVLPVASTRKTEVSASDWTCIAVGLSNGYVNFYTERGIIIFYEKVSNYRIISMRFGHSALTGDQELVCLSKNRLAVIEGYSLFTTLRLAKGQIARGDKNVDEISETQELNSKYLKLALMTRVTDFQITGLKKPSTFEQYATASMSDLGVNAQIRPGLPTFSTYFCVSENLFGAFIWHNFYEQQVHLTDYVSKVASNITSYVPSIGFRSFLGIGTSKKDQPIKTHTKDARVETAYIRLSLNDKGRVADRLFMAPRPWPFLAVADESARVLIIDTDTRRICRLFKGYRNARCAFIESTGNIKESKKSVKALFLVIFAPKRGLLEIWRMPNGPRVSAFNVDTKGRLLSLSIGHDGILGMPPDEQLIFKQQTTSALFINSDGQIFTITTPFRLAALGSSESAVHDENLYKEFKIENVIENNDLNIDKFVDFIQALRTITYRRKTMGLIIRSSKISSKMISKAISQLMDVYGNQMDESRKLSLTENHTFLVYLQLLDRILKFYLYLKSIYPESVSTKSDDYVEWLKLTETEVDDLYFDLIEKFNKNQVNLPKFPSLKLFVDQFDLNSFSSTPLSTAQTLSGVVNFTPKDDDGKLSVISAMFVPFLFGEIDGTELVEEMIPLSGIEIEEGIEMLLTFWLSKYNVKPLLFVSRLIQLLKIIQKVLTKSFLQRLEDQIKLTENVQSGLFFMLSIRALNRWEIFNKGVPKDVDAGVDAFDVDDQWEQMDEYFEYWDLLIKNLSVLTLYDLLPKSPKVSLNKLIEKGNGYYREQMGIWIAITLPNCDDFVELLNGNDYNNIEGGEIIKALKMKLPYSLRTDLTIGDCSWECASSWFKDETRRVTKLSISTKLLKMTNKCARLQHGLSIMLWDTFLRQPFEKLYKFLNLHDGRQPRDRESRREILVSDTDLYEFINCIERLLRSLIYSVVDLEQQEIIQHKYESYLIRFMDYINLTKSNKMNRPTLAEIACKHKSVNYHLIQHHLHLILTLKLKFLFSLQLQPKTLFDGIGHRGFFEQLHSHPLIPLHKVEELIIKRRQRFLIECVQNIGTNSDANQQEQWQIILELATEWQLNVDILRIKEIFMYYDNNMDDNGEKLISIIKDRKQLAIELLPIIIGRILYFEDNDFYQTIFRKSLASRTTVDYLKTFSNNELPSYDVNLESTLKLIRLVHGLLLQTNDKESSSKINILNDLKNISNYIMSKT